MRSSNSSLSITFANLAASLLPGPFKPVFTYMLDVRCSCVIAYFSSHYRSCFVCEEIPPEHFFGFEKKIAVVK